jgi:hypothetical protein
LNHRGKHNLCEFGEVNENPAGKPDKVSKVLGRQITLNMPIESKIFHNSIIVTQFELDRCIFLVEFHTILKGL